MKKGWFVVLVGLCLIGLSAACAQELAVDDLVYLAEEYPPANYVENGVLKGASVEMLKLLWQAMGYPEQPIQVVPWARGYALVQTEKNHVLFTMSRTPERERLFKWVGPIFMARHVLVGLAAGAITLDSLEDAKRYKIGVLRDDVGETSLLQAGFDRANLESATHLEQNIKKLLAGRVDFICQSEDAVRELVEMYHYDPALLKTFLVVNEMGNYYAFHKDTPDALIQQFQAAFDSLHAEHLEILARYRLNP